MIRLSKEFSDHRLAGVVAGFARFLSVGNVVATSSAVRRRSTESEAGKHACKAVGLAILFLAFAADGAHAILLTPPAKPGTFALGATELWFHRTTKWDDRAGSVEDQFNLGTFWARYGAHRHVTVFVEFAILNGDPHNEGTSYRHINLGVGVNALLVEFEDFYVSAVLNYFENFQHDNQETTCHSITRHWAGLLQVGKTFPLTSRHETTLWWGPAFIKDQQIFDGGSCLNGRKESKDNLGVAAGADFLFWKHLEVFGHVVWADYFQPRLGIGYQF